MFSHAAGSATSKPVARSRDCTDVPSSSSRPTTAAPIPDAPPVTMALRNKDDLPDVLSVLDQPVGVRRLREGELRADDRLHRPGGPEPQQFTGGLDDDVGAPSHEPAEIEALDAHV